ncbi:MAG: DUF2461 domain-containing protein [Litoreibacter sp.]
MSDDGFTQMIDDGNTLFAQLAQNNTKEWFAPHKDHYIEGIRKPAELFAKLLAEDLSQMTGMAYTPKVFRIYRDIRFSKDKTPLNTHLHIVWNPGEARFAPAVRFISAPSNLTIGMGVMGLKGDDLNRYRAFIDKWGNSFQEAVAATGMTASDWGEAPLKRVPKPYSEDHPHAELLKQKQIIIGRSVSDEWRSEGIYKTVKDVFRQTAPLREVLAKHLGAD